MEPEMIEAKIQELIDALNANTAAIQANAGAANTTAATTTASTEKAGKTGGKAKADTTEKTAKQTKTKDEATAALMKLKDDFNIDEARKILKQFKYEKMADIKEADFDNIFNAATKLHEELTTEADGDGGGDDGL
jgi:hypothetical protein